jgi:serine/threonine protein kinase
MTKLTEVLLSTKDDFFKIGDFGCCAEGTSKRMKATKDQRGSAGYRAPEVIREEAYNNKADIWALGCIFYELCIGQKAFSNDWAVIHYALQSTQGLPKPDLPEWPITARPEADDVDIGLENFYTYVTAMLSLKPDQRPSAASVVELYPYAGYFEIYSP